MVHGMVRGMVHMVCYMTCYVTSRLCAKWLKVLSIFRIRTLENIKLSI